MIETYNRPNKMKQANKELLRRTKIAFWVNLVLCLISFTVLYKSIESETMWRIIASSIGFVVFLSFTLLAFREMNRVKKG